MKIEKIMYHDRPGEENTDATLQIAHERAKALHISNIVVASVSGRTAIKAIDLFQDNNVIVVRHHTGFEQPGVQQMSKEYEQRILEKNVKLLTASHSLSGIERGIRNKFDTMLVYSIRNRTIMVRNLVIPLSAFRVYDLYKNFGLQEIR